MSYRHSVRQNQNQLIKAFRRFFHAVKAWNHQNCDPSDYGYFWYKLQPSDYNYSYPWQEYLEWLNWYSELTIVWDSKDPYQQWENYWIAESFDPTITGFSEWLAHWRE